VESRSTGKKNKPVLQVGVPLLGLVVPLYDQYTKELEEKGSPGKELLLIPIRTWRRNTKRKARTLELLKDGCRNMVNR
jgi:hypothetical protein